MYRCKYMEIEDTNKRSQVMEITSEKEEVLYVDKFRSSTNQNQEFVVGLPVELANYENFNYANLAADYAYHAKAILQTDDLAIAIHSKLQIDELHFHISFNNDLLPEQNMEFVGVVQNVFSTLNQELLANLD